MGRVRAKSPIYACISIELEVTFHDHPRSRGHARALSPGVALARVSR